MISDIPDGKYDDFFIFGIGMVDVEFPLDVYRKPNGEMPERISMKDGYFLGSALEIAVQEKPRDIKRHDPKELRFGDIRGYFQEGRNFSVVRKEDWTSEWYEWREDIPAQYNDLFVYGIGMEYLPMEMRDSRCRVDSVWIKQMVIVLSQTPGKAD